VLTPEMESTMRDSKWLRSTLSDSTLRSLLLEIDGAPDRKRKLEEARRKYPDLNAFVDRMLLEIDAVRYEDGRLVFVA
jgi:hypothetical protein